MVAEELSAEDLKALSARVQGEYPQPVALAWARAQDPERGSGARLASLLYAWRLAAQVSALWLLRPHLQSRPRPWLAAQARAWLIDNDAESWLALAVGLARLEAPARVTPLYGRLAAAVLALEEARAGRQSLQVALWQLQERAFYAGLPESEERHAASLERAFGLVGRALALLEPLGSLELLHAHEGEVRCLRGQYQEVEAELGEELGQVLQVSPLVGRDRETGAVSPLVPLLRVEEGEVLLLESYTGSESAWSGGQRWLRSADPTLLERLRVMLEPRDLAREQSAASLRERALAATEATLTLLGSKKGEVKGRAPQREAMEGAIWAALGQGEAPVCLLLGEPEVGLPWALAGLARRALAEAGPEDAVLLCVDDPGAGSWEGALCAALGLRVEESGGGLQRLLARWQEGGGNVTIVLQMELEGEDGERWLASLDRLAQVAWRERQVSGRPWLRVVVGAHGSRLRVAMGERERVREAPPLQSAFGFVHFVGENGLRRPWWSLSLLTEEEAAQGYTWAAHAMEEHCPAPWEKLPAATRRALRTVTHLRLFHEAFAGVTRPEEVQVDALWDRVLAQRFSRGREARALEQAAIELMGRALSGGLTEPDEAALGALRGEWAQECGGDPEALLRRQSPVSLLLRRGALRRSLWGYALALPELRGRLGARWMMLQGEGSALMACQAGLGLPPGAARDDALVVLGGVLWDSLREKSLAALRRQGEGASRDVLARVLLRAIQRSPNMNAMRLGLDAVAAQARSVEQLRAWKEALLWYVRPAIDAPEALHYVTELAALLCERLHEAQPQAPEHLRDLRVAYLALEEVLQVHSPSQAQGWALAARQSEEALRALESGSASSPQPLAPRLVATLEGLEGLWEAAMRRAADPRCAPGWAALARQRLQEGSARQASAPEAARRAFEEARVFSEHLHALEPEQARHLHTLASACQALAVLDVRVAPAQALAWTRRQVEAAEQLASLRPQDRETLRYLASSLNQLGDLLAQQPEEARASYERALEVRRALVFQAPEDLEAQRSLCNSYHRLGRLETHHSQRKARAWFEQEIALCARLVKERPDDEGLLRNLSVAYFRLAELETSQDPRRARALFAQDAAIAEELLRRAPQDMQRLRDLLSTYQKLHEFRDLETPDEGAERAEREMELLQRLVGMAPGDEGLYKAALRMSETMELLEPSLPRARVGRWRKQRLDVFEQLLRAAPEHPTLLLQAVRCCWQLSELHQEEIPQAAMTWLVRGLERLERLEERPLPVLFLYVRFYGVLGRLEEPENAVSARRWRERQLEMLEEVLHQDYQHDGALWELTEVYDSLGRMSQRKAPQEALAWYQRAMATRARLLALRSEPGALVRAYESRQGALGHHPGERAPLTRWLEGAEDALEHLLAADARNPELQRDLAVAQALLGDLAREAHRREEARRLYERALARLQRQASLWRQEPRLLRDLVNLYQRLEELEPSRGEAAARWRAQREEALRQLEALERGA